MRRHFTVLFAGFLVVGSLMVVGCDDDAAEEETDEAADAVQQDDDDDPTGEAASFGRSFLEVARAVGALGPTRNLLSINSPMVALQLVSEPLKG